MPKAYACRAVGCAAISLAPGYCLPHRMQHERMEQRAVDAKRLSAKKRGYDRNWEKLRPLVLARDPICRSCGKAPSTDVDHIEPLRRGGKNEMNNLQGLCRPCHSRKTAISDGRWGYGHHYAR